jgi:hypothetical protein
MAKKKTSTAKATTANHAAGTTKKAAKPRGAAKQPVLINVVEATSDTSVVAAAPQKSLATFDVEAIGRTAGEVWGLLHEAGDVPLSTIKKQLDLPADLVAAALGWLAREGKLAIETSGRATLVRLCE